VSLQLFCTCRIDRITDDDLRKVDEFLDVMSILYTSTLVVSSDRYATCSQILPILLKIEKRFKISDNDSAFSKTLKTTVWSDIEKRYKVSKGYCIKNYLDETRFPHLKMNNE